MESGQKKARSALPSSTSPERDSAVDWVEETSLESFPASDAPSWVTGKDWQPKSATESPLRVRQLIPPLTLRLRDGNVIHAWDFKQKKNLVIVFLDAGCSRCETFIRDLANCTADLSEKETVVLSAFPREPQQSLRDVVSDPLFAGEANPRDLRAFLGENVFPRERLSCRGVFVTDRYGEIAGLWITHEHEFPGMGQILSMLNTDEAHRNPSHSCQLTIKAEASCDDAVFLPLSPRSSNLRGVIRAR
jgi:hypothetical protein